MRELKFLFILFLLSISSKLFAIDYFFEPIIKNPTTANNLCWNEDNSMFAYYENMYIIIRDSQTYEVISTIQQQDVQNICFSKEGNENVLITFLKNGQFSLWKFNNQNKDVIESVPYFNVDCKTSFEITATAISNNSDYLAVAYDDNSIKIFYKLRLINQTMSFNLGKMEQKVKYLSFSHDNRYLLSGLENGKVYLWNCTSNKIITTINESYISSGVKGVVSDNDVIAIPSDDHSILFYDKDAEIIDKIFTDSSIKIIKYLPFTNEFAVLTENNKIHLIDSKKDNYYESGYIFPVNLSNIVDFEFNSERTQLLVNYTDGSLYKFNVSDVFLRPNAKAPEVFIDHVEKDLSDFISFYSSATLINSIMSFGTSLGTEYAHVIPKTPVYFGGGINCNLCYPSFNFPYTYTIGQNCATPYLFDSTFYGDVAFFLNPSQKEYFITIELKTGLRMINLFLYENRFFVDMNPKLTFYTDLEIGVLYKAFIFKFLYEYDSYEKFCPGIIIGGNIKIE